MDQEDAMPRGDNREHQVGRRLPRPFHYEWGSGSVIDEVSAPNEHYEPVIQLLRVEGGFHDGEEMIRFCFYSPKGAFQRHPMVVDKDDITALSKALKDSPRIRRMLKKLVGG